MTDYELIFITRPLTEDQEFTLLDKLDCIVGRRHDGLSFVTTWVAGDDAETAANYAHALLVAAGVAVQRMEFDLAGRSELAHRLGVTRQAIGNYVRGERRLGAPFPAMFSDVAGGVWLWGDVVDWYRNQGLDDPRPGIGYPNRADIESFNADLHASRARTSVPIQVESESEARVARTHPVPRAYRYTGDRAA